MITATIRNDDKIAAQLKVACPLTPPNLLPYTYVHVHGHSDDGIVKGVRGRGARIKLVALVLARRDG